jgi:hypothetical protein
MWDRVLEYKDATPERTATVNIIRDDGFAGGGCYLAVAVNEKIATRIDTEEIATLHVEPGPLKLSIGLDSMGGGMCGRSDSKWKDLHTTIAANETQYYRVGNHVSGATHIPLYGIFHEAGGHNRHHFIEPYYPDQQKPTVRVETDENVNATISEKDNLYSELKKLKELRDEGIISEPEFEKEKKELLEKY